MLKKLKSHKGQMVVELAVVFPILIIIAVVMVNALGFASECVQFDRWARSSVIAHASAPELDKSTQDIMNEIGVEMEVTAAYPNEEATATLISASDSEIIVECELLWHPTLFGMKLNNEVFGMKLFQLSHKCKIKVDPTRSGDVF